MPRCPRRPELVALTGPYSAPVPRRRAVGGLCPRAAPVPHEPCGAPAGAALGLYDPLVMTPIFVSRGPPARDILCARCPLFVGNAGIRGFYAASWTSRTKIRHRVFFRVSRLFVRPPTKRFA